MKKTSRIDGPFLAAPVCAQGCEHITVIHIINSQ